MIHHVHSPISADTESRFRNIRNAMLERLALHRADKLIPVSNSLHEHVSQRGYSSSKLHTVFNGVPSPGFTCDVQASADIACVALMRPRKGIEVLVRAFASVPENLGARLRLIGPFEADEYEQFIRSLCNELGLGERVDFTGFCSDVPAELAKCGVFCLPSLYGEGMPMVILEAMAAGLPVVSTRVEGISEQIVEGQHGFLCDAGDTAALAAHLTRLCSDSSMRQEMGRAAQMRHAAEFSEKAMAGGVAAVYRQLLGGQS